jgi:hypothetical protein
MVIVSIDSGANTATVGWSAGTPVVTRTRPS